MYARDPSEGGAEASLIDLTQKYQGVVSPNQTVNYTIDPNKYYVVSAGLNINDSSTNRAECSIIAKGVQVIRLYSYGDITILNNGTTLRLKNTNASGYSLSVRIIEFDINIEY